MKRTLQWTLASLSLAGALWAMGQTSPATTQAKMPLTAQTAGVRNLSVHDPSTIVQ